MRLCKMSMFVLGVVLVVIGFSSQISTLLQIAGSYVGMSKQEVCIILGSISLIMLVLVNLVDRSIKKSRQIRRSDQLISDFERRLLGKVVTMSDLRNCRDSKVNAPKIEVDDKESRYLAAQKKMEERRKVAPPLKKKKVSTAKEERPSLKSRVGGVRRAS